MQSRQSIVSLFVSFCGVNFLLAGVCVVLFPHFLVSRALRSWRRISHAPPALGS